MRLNLKAPPWFVTLITLFFAAFYMFIYLGGELAGEMQWHVLSAKRFGIPAPLIEKGITPLYLGEKQTGWDGQFYYYIANDLRGTPETGQHIDAKAYRYQRVGLPLLAKLVSIVILQDWVSPFTYYFTNLGLILLATYLLASYIYEKKYNPLLVFFWSLSLGTQLTLINGLPDAAADSFLIIGLICFLRKQLFFYVIAISFAALSRETYILIPGFIAVWSAWRWYKSTPRMFMNLVKIGLLNAVPIIVWLAWHFYITIHFQESTTKQAMDGRILGWPLVSWFHFWWADIKNWQSFTFLSSFLILLVTGLCLSIKGLYSDKNKENWALQTTCFAFLPISLLYFAFGHTVMFDYTGYMKAISIFFFLVPFLFILAEKKVPLLLVGFLAGVTLLGMFKFYDRIGNSDHHLFQFSEYPAHLTSIPENLPCVKAYKSKLDLLDVQDFYQKANWFRDVRSAKASLLKLRVTNLTKGDIVPARGIGAMYLSYQFLNDKNEVIKEGTRTVFPEKLASDESMVLPLVLEYPKKHGMYTLAISLIQENCAWFYVANDPGAIKMSVRY